MRNVFPVEAQIFPPRSPQTKGTVLLVCFWHVYGAHTVCRPKVTMFAVEMWFGVGDGVECGRSTGLCPLPLGVPCCVIHNKKMLERNFGNFEKKIILTTKTIPTMQRNKKLSNDKTSTSGFVHNKPKEPSLWFVNRPKTITP